MASETPRSSGDWTPRAVFSLSFLTLISAFNYLDRSILGLALPLIKAQMAVSDTVLGLVSGLAFVLFYSLLGIPIAWLADRWNRRNIIALGFAFWSVMTVATSLVLSVLQLAFARFLMGIGEACGTAPANSLLSDLFRKPRRPLVLAIFGTAYSIAMVVFYPGMGYIAEHYGWRAMFVVAGTPGIFLSAIFFLTVKEPRRGATDDVREAADADPSLWSTLRFLAGSRTYWLLLVGCAFMGSNIYAAAAWNPTFLRRVHHLTLTEVASSLGPILGILGALGIVVGGMLASRLGRRDERWRLRVPAIACLLVAPFQALFLLGNSLPVWLAAFASTGFFLLVFQGPVYAAAMNVATVRMRAVATSVILLFASLVGQIFGPLLVGFLNDRLQATYGDLAIRYSMLVTVGCPIAAGVAFLAAIRSLDSDTRRAAHRGTA